MAVGDYRLLEKIGAGSFATVWKASHRFTGEVVAVKEIVPRNHEELELVAREKSIMESVSHSNIVKFLGIVEGQECISGKPSTKYLIMEFCEGGDLDNYIRVHKKLDVEVTRTIMLQLALAHARASEEVHRDLKPHNLLLKNRVHDMDGSDIVMKLTDFGMARTLQPQGMAQTVCGTYLYMAPEVIKKHKYDAKADLWSVGVMLYQMVTGRKLFVGHDVFHLRQNISRGKVDFLDEDLWDPDCRNLCEGLLRKNPVERISFEELFNHKFLRRTSVSNSKVLVSDASASNSQIHVQEMNVDEKTSDQELKDSARVMSFQQKFRTPWPSLPMETIPGSRHKHPPKEQVIDSIDEKVRREYVVISPRSSFKNKKHCPIPRSPKPSSSSSSSKNHRQQQQQQQQQQHDNQQVSKEDQERGKTLRICAKLLQEVAKFKLEEDKKLEALSLYLAALQALKQACSISSTSQFLPDLSLALDEATGMAADLDNEQIAKKLPEAAEVIYQAALLAGRAGAVDELLNKSWRASVEYAKALTLLFFLVMEDSPVHLHSSDAARVRQYFDAIRERHRQCKI